jgi:hypothetical protein
LGLVGLDPAVLDPAASAREVISVVEMDLISKTIQAGICNQEERYLRRTAVFGLSGKRNSFFVRKRLSRVGFT